MHPLTIIPILALLTSGVTAATGPRELAPGPVVLWHPFQQADEFAAIVEQFSRQHGVAIVLETGMETAQALVETMDEDQPPDMVITASDLVGLADQVRLSPVPEAWLRGLSREVRESVQLHDRLYGVPVLDGNHLMQFCNRRKLTAGRPLPAGETIWLRNEPYYFMPFLWRESFPGYFPGQDMSWQKLGVLLETYQSLAAHIPRSCAYDCLSERFYQGEYACVINGEWAVQEAWQRLGEDLVVLPLPGGAEQGGKPALLSPRLTHALLFPGDGLSGSHGQILQKFAAWILSIPVQAEIAARLQRIPVRAEALELVRPRWNPAMQAAADRLAGAVMIRPSPAVTSFWPLMRKALVMNNAGLEARQVAAYIESRFMNVQEPHP